jgi:predicted AAA+ superfamily ATPase
MFERSIALAIQEVRRYYPILYLGGPRQSGKTTLLRSLFADLPYANLESPELRLLAEQDPRRFLGSFVTAGGAVLDEAQRVPHLFSYLQVMVDENRALRFMLSGSQNFLMMESITQSLAGRVGILNLFPLSLAELQKANFYPASIEDFVWRGGYPALYHQGTPPSILFNNYIQTYLERDVRLLRNIGDLSLFNRFLRLCAGRVGQPLNMTNLANDTGLSVNTIKSWLSVLEASYLIFYLPPYYQNFTKRIIKSPKYYFFDTGLLCHLLGIESPTQLSTHHFYGQIVENAIIADLYKKRTNAGQKPTFWFWQDQHGSEVDLLIEEAGQLVAVEIKSAYTFNTRMMSGLTKWRQLSGSTLEDLYLVYAGDQTIQLSDGHLITWQQALHVL